MKGLGKFTVTNHCKLYDYCLIRKTFNPYFRCSHFCIYCNSSFGFEWSSLLNHPKSIIAVDIDKAIDDYHNLPPYSQINISSSCDPFDLIYEKEHQITYEFLKRIKENERNDIYINFITKSNLISSKKYLDVLPNNHNCIVQISVEGYGEQLKVLSPNASTYKQRLDTAQTLGENDFKVSLRIEPVIPSFISLKNLEDIIEDFELNGIKHITASMLRLMEVQIDKIEDKISGKLRPSLIKNNKGYYIKREIRLLYFTKIKELCEKKGLSYAFCKDNLIEDNGFCDPFHLINFKNLVKKKRFLNFTEFL